MGKKKDVEFNRTMIYILDKGKVIVLVGWFTVGDTIRSGLCYVDLSLDESEQEVIIDYNFGKNKLKLSP